MGTYRLLSLLVVLVLLAAPGTTRAGDLPPQADKLIKDFESEARTIRQKADAEIEAREDELIKDLKKLQKELLLAEKTDEAQAVANRVQEILKARKQKGQVQQNEEAERKKLEGKWRVENYFTSAGPGGIAAGHGAREPGVYCVVIIRDGKMEGELERGGAKVDFAIELVTPSKNPPGINLKFRSGDHKGETLKGIYRLDGDTLRICWSPPGEESRPNDLGGNKGDTILELKRIATFD